jgi:hypothetical protein
VKRHDILSHLDTLVLLQEENNKEHASTWLYIDKYAVWKIVVSVLPSFLKIP